VRRQADGTALRADFRSHHALGPWSKAHEDKLAGAQFRKAVTTQRFHVHENIFGAFAAREETETAQPVEPFHLRTLQAAGRRNADMRARRRHRGRMHRGRFIHRENAECLQSTRPLLHFADDASTLMRSLKAVAPQTGDVQQNIRHAVIRHDEAETFGDIKPFDDAAELDEVFCGFVGAVVPDVEIDTVRLTCPCRAAADQAPLIIGALTRITQTRIALGAER
jgi:hypothetical protein